MKKCSKDREQSPIQYLSAEKHANLKFIEKNPTNFWSNPIQFYFWHFFQRPHIISWFHHKDLFSALFLFLGTNVLSAISIGTLIFVLHCSNYFNLHYICWELFRQEEACHRTITKFALSAWFRICRLHPPAQSIWLRCDTMAYLKYYKSLTFDLHSKDIRVTSKLWTACMRRPYSGNKHKSPSGFV